MPIGNDVLSIEGFLINLADASAHISSCGVDITISDRYYSEFLKRRMLAHATTFIPPKSEAFVLFQQIPLPDTRNFFFYLSPQPQLTLYSHLLDHTSSKVLV